MATIDQYKIKIDVQGREQVKQLEQDLDSVDGTIGKLGSTLTNLAVIAGAAFATLGMSAVRMADQIVDLAGTAGMSVDKIYQMSVAAEAAGGNFDDTGGMLLKFSNSIDSAVQGSDKMLDSLAKIGIGKQELEYLSDEQLFQAVVDGLAGMEDGALKTALTMELLGKKAATMDMGKFAEEMQKSTDPSIAANMQLAADAVGSMETAFRNLQVAALDAISPILELIAKLKIDVDAAKKIIQVFGALLAGAFSFTVVNNIRAVIGLFKKLADVMRGVAAIQTFITGMTGVGLLAIAAATAASIGAYVALGKAMESAEEDAAGLNTELGKTPAGSSGPSTRGRGTGDPIRAPETSDRTKQLGQQALLARQQTDEMIRQNREANKLREQTISLIGIETTRANLIKSNTQAEINGRNQVAQLDARIAQERAKGKDTNPAIIVELEKQKAIIEQQVEATKRLNEEEYKRLLQQEKIKINNEEFLSVVSLLYQGERNKTEYQIRSQEILGKISSEEAARKIEMANMELEHFEKIVLLQAQLGQIKEGDDEAEKHRLNSLIKLEYDRYEAAKSRAEKIRALEIERDNSAAAGAQSAIDRITKSITPFQVAQEQTTLLFDRMSQGLEDFVKNGKLDFKSFALSIIRDLLLIQIKAQAMKLLTGIFSGTMLGSIFGLAGGGPTKAGQPYVVGEKGPELFVPKSAGTIIPNNVISRPEPAATSTGGASSNTYITNNISAVDAKSVAQLFAENRRVLLGSIQMAQKEMPYANI